MDFEISDTPVDYDPFDTESQHADPFYTAYPKAVIGAGANVLQGVGGAVEYVGEAPERKRQEIKDSIMTLLRKGAPEPLSVPESAPSLDDSEDYGLIDKTLTQLGKVVKAGGRAARWARETTPAKKAAVLSAQQRLNQAATMPVGLGDKLGTLTTEVSPEIASLINKGDDDSLRAAYQILEDDETKTLGERNVLHKYIASAGKKTADFFGDISKKITPKTERGSLLYYGTSAVQGVLPSLGMGVAATVLTKNPSIGYGLMFGQVAGQTYNEERTAGRTTTQAANTGIFYGLTEVLSEGIPLGILTKEGGKLVPRVIKGVGSEGLQELINEAVQIGYDESVIGKNTPPEEIGQRLWDAGIIGAVGGGGAALAVHPFVSKQENAKKVKADIMDSVVENLQKGGQEKEDALSAMDRGLNEGFFSEADVNKIKKDAEAADVNRQQAVHTISLIDEGMKTGKIGESQFTHENALSIIKEGYNTKLFIKEDIDGFREKYPALRKELNEIIVEDIKSQIEKELKVPATDEAILASETEKDLAGLPKETAPEPLTGKERLLAKVEAKETVAAEQEPLKEGSAKKTAGSLGSIDYIEAKKHPSGHYQLFFRGTRNEIFPNEKFNSAHEARQYWKALKAKEDITKATPLEEGGQEVISEEDYLEQKGASRFDIGDAALHKNIPEGNIRKKLVDAQSEKDRQLLEKRDILRKEYQGKVEAGEIRPPTREERLKTTAAGHPDLEATQAARKILEKRAVKASGDEDTTKVPETITGAPVQEIDIKSIKHSPDVVQFKEGADKKGVVEGEELVSDKYERLGNAPIVLWERKNGDLDIVTGRHRFDLAQRLGEKTIPAQIVKESDGFTAKKAAIFDAESNIRDEKGSVRDYAAYFKGTGITEEQASGRGLLSRAKGRDGFIIGKHASDDLYALYRNKELNGQKTAAIAKAAPKNKELQLIGAKYAASNTAQDTANYMEAIKTIIPTDEPSQINLFGENESWQVEANKLAKAAVKMERKLQQEQTLLKAASKLDKDKHKDFIKKYGINPGDAKAISNKIDENKEKLYKLNNWAAWPEIVKEIKQIGSIHEDKQQPIFDKSGKESVGEDERNRYGRAETGKEGSVEESQRQLSFAERKIDYGKGKDETRFPSVVSGRAGSYISGVNAIKTTKDAAAFAHLNLSKYAQEHFSVILLDKNKNILLVHRYSIGTPTNSLVTSSLITGHAFNTPDAKSLILIHNHPSGDPALSQEDKNVFSGIQNLLDGTEIDVSDMIAVGEKKYSSLTEGAWIISPVPDVKVTSEISVVERVFKTKGENLQKISNEKDAADYGEKNLPSGGLLLLNIKNDVVGTIPSGDYSFLRKGMSKNILKQVEASNATAMIAYSPDKITDAETLNLKKFANAASLALHDVIDKRGSSHAMGLLPITGQTTFYSTKKPAKPQDTITRDDLKEIFSSMQNVTTGVNLKGNFYFRVGDNKPIEILEVDHINGYVNTSSGRIPVGSFLKNTIELKTGGEGVKADTSTVWHEFTHYLEANGIISGNDIKALNGAVAKFKGVDISKVTAEDRADYAGNNLSAWQKNKNLRIRRVLKKIADFMNAVYEFVTRTRTARGVFRDVESGKILSGQKTAAPLKKLTQAYQQTADRFYSQVIKTVQDKMPDKMAASDVMNWLEKQHGIKKAELEWMNIEEMLEGRKFVTKDELIGLLKENEVVVEEVVKKTKKIFYRNPNIENAEHMSTRKLINAVQEKLEKEHGYFDGIESIAKKIAITGQDYVVEDDYLTKYADLQLPGKKENYQEFFLTMPNTKGYLWKDGHNEYSDIKNPIVRVRMNERADSNGNNVLFLEEIQKPLYEEQKKMPAIAKNFAYEMALKRIVRMASEQGINKVAWITGEQTADRYDLIKYLNEVHYSGTNLKAYDHNGKEVISETGITKEQLPDYLGKEVAQRLLEQKPTDSLRSLSGLDLKVGGEWAYKLYDKMIPQFLKKFGKKYGANVSSVEINGNKQPSFEITPSLKKEALFEGMPLFQMAGVQAETAPTGALAKAQKMLAEGRNDREIWSKTGWIKTSDNKFKFEIDDSGAKLKDLGLGKKIHKMSDVFDHKELYAAYPELKEIRIHSDLDYKDKWTGGSYFHGKGLEGDILSRGRIMLSGNPDKAMGTILHEIQHAIQSIEGFGSGGNPAMFEGIDSHNKYLKLLGEIEARDTQARMKLNKAWRKAEMPYESQGIPREDWIIIDGKGTSFSVEENAEKQFSTKPDLNTIEGLREAYKKSVKPVKGSNENLIIPEEDGIIQNVFDMILGNWKKRKITVEKEKKKLTLLEHHLGTTMFNAKRIGGAYERFYNEVRKLGEYKFQKQNELRNSGDASFFTPLESLKKENKIEYARLGRYLVQKDIDAIGYRVAKTLRKEAKYEGAYDIIKDGIVIDTMASEEKAWRTAWDMEADETRFSDMGKDALVNYRKMTRNLYKHYAKGMEDIIAMAEKAGKPVPEVTIMENGKIKGVSLRVAMKRMGDRQGYYFPRIRQTGEWRVEGTMEGRPNELNFFPTKLQAKQKIHALERKGYSATMTHSGQFSEDLFQQLSPLLAQEQVINKVIDRVSKNEDFEAVFADAFIKQYETELKSHGSRARMIGRSDATGIFVKRGYETDPLKAIAMATEAAAGGFAKQQIAINGLKTITGRDLTWSEYLETNKDATYEDYLKEVRNRGMDAARQQKEYKEAIATLQNILKNPEFSDKVIGTLKGMAVVWYLGGRISSAAVNTTNMVMAVPATMKGELGVSFNKAFTNIVRAGKEYGKYRFNKKQPGGENVLFAEIEKRGWDAPQFNMEALNSIQTKYGKAWRRTIDYSMAMFGFTEKINRATTIAGNYMALCEKNNISLTDQNGSLNEAFLIKARDVSDLAHGVYEKGNRPYHMRGEHIGARILQMTYVFQTFTHNYLQEMIRLGLVKREYAAATYMALSGGLLGGVGATIPIAIAKAIFNLFGGDDPEEKIIEWAEQAFGGGDLVRYGLPGLVGVSLKGSLTTRFEVPETTLEWFGAPGNVVADIYQGTKNLTKGFYQEGLEQIAPVAIGNISRGIRESTEGVTTKYGSPVFFGDDQIKGDTYDMMLRWMSFNPTNISSKREIQWNEYKIQNKYKEKKSDLYKRYKQFYSEHPLRRNPNDLSEIMADMRDFNKEIENKKISRLISPFTDKSRKQSLRLLTPRKSERERR